jgi:hypothetical protein
MPYHLSGDQVLFDWLASEQSPEARGLVLDWIAVLAEDPHAIEAPRLPGSRADVRAILIPGTAVSATFLIAEEFRTVRLIELVTVTGGSP